MNLFQTHYEFLLLEAFQFQSLPRDFLLFFEVFPRESLLFQALPLDSLLLLLVQLLYLKFRCLFLLFQQFCFLLKLILLFEFLQKFHQILFYQELFKSKIVSSLGFKISNAYYLIPCRLLLFFQMRKSVSFYLKVRKFITAYIPKKEIYDRNINSIFLEASK